MKFSFIISTILLLAINTHAQIGYQVSLLDQETGAPRANEYVTVQIDLTDNEGNTICSENKSATTNEFGIISLSIGNENTFDSMDWSKLPLWISATVDGIIIGKSQVLNIPVAEYAKRTGTLTKELLCSKTWSGNNGSIKLSYSFFPNGTCFYTYQREDGAGTVYGTYEIDNNLIFLFDDKGVVETFRYSPTRKSISSIEGGRECF